MKENVSYLEAVEKGLPFKAIDILHALCEDENFSQNGEDRELFAFIMEHLYGDGLNEFISNIKQCMAGEQTIWHKTQSADFINDLCKVFKDLKILIEVCR